MKETKRYRQVAEKALGHELPKGAVVHHVDQNRKNSSNDNLVILQSTAEHAQLHRRLRVQKAGGDPWTQHICTTCGVLRDLTEYSTRPSSYTGRSNECRKCTAARAHEIWCARTGRESRYLTPEEFSSKQSNAAKSRWIAES